MSLISLLLENNNLPIDSKQQAYIISTVSYNYHWYINDAMALTQTLIITIQL